MSQKQADDIRQSVRDSYSKVAEASDAGECCGVATSCCGVSADINSVHSTRLGNSEDDLKRVPGGADMGLGCGNPRAIASLQADEVVLDLGSGGGFDAFLATREIGTHGRVIGVDMTPAMVSKARRNAQRAGLRNLEFRLGEIEHLPVADCSVDVIMSNCVINLSPDKAAVFAEAFRVLKPGGRVAVSDIVTEGEFSEELRADTERWAECVTGAIDVDLYTGLMRAAGFVNIAVADKVAAGEIVPQQEGMPRVYSARITANKPS